MTSGVTPHHSCDNLNCLREFHSIKGSYPKMSLPRPIALIIVAMLARISPTFAATSLYPAKAYDATYEKRSPEMIGTTRIVSDGKGHVRIEQVDSKRHGVSIYDYGTGEVSMIGGSTPTIVKMPLQSNKLYSASDEKMLKACGAKKLGHRDIDGHQCNGYEFKTAGSIVHTWIDEEAGCPVLQLATTERGKSELKLKSLTRGVPAPELFVVPQSQGKSSEF